MLVKNNILRSLKELELRYNGALRSPTPQDSIYFSKLAILEYCGWIEESFDQIIRRSVKGKLKTQEFKQILEGSVIGNTYGFQYKRHFRTMLCRAVGLMSAEIVEKHLKDSGKLELLISELESVKTYRNCAAHTWINGTTQTYPAPSYIRVKFEHLYPIMKGIYTQVVHL